MELNEEQKKTIQNSIWAVNSVLKTLKLVGTPEYKDIRSNAILYMCKCLLRFDPSKNIKWSTYAYKSIYYYVLSRYAIDKKKTITTINIDLCFSVAEKNSDAEQEISNKRFVKQLLEVLTPFQRQIVELVMMGYSRSTICKTHNISRAKMVYTWSCIKAKAEKLQNPNDNV